MEQRFVDALYILKEGKIAYKDIAIKHPEEVGAIEMGEFVLSKLKHGDVIRDIAITFDERKDIINEGLALETLGNAPAMRDLKVNCDHFLS